MLHSTVAHLRRFVNRWLSWIIGIAAFFFYASRTAPGIITFFDDSLEFQFVAPTFGIAHPTGYPLYTLLAGMWTHLLPVGTWAGRANLFSALAAAITVGLVTHVTTRLVTDHAGRPNLWAGVTAALCFGLGPVWVSQATGAEVYTLHNALVAAILAITIGINQTLDQGEPTAQTDRRVLGIALLFGLGLAHHRTIILMAPPILLYLLWSAPTLLRPRRVWWLWAGALVGPLLLYLYLPLRAAAGVRDLNGSYDSTWRGFWDHVLARAYTDFFASNPLDAGLSAADWLALVVAQMGWLGLALALLGLVWLVDRTGRPARAWWLILAVLLVNLAFALLYRVPDPEVFLLPALLALAIFAGGGVGLIARLLPNPAVNAPLQTALILLLVWLPLGRVPAVDHSGNWRAHDRARRMAQADFPPGSVVLGIEGEMTALRYMQVAEGLALLAIPQTADDPAQRRAALAEQLAAGAPVYLTRELEGIAETYNFSGDADLVRVRPRGTAPRPTLPTSAPPTPVGDSVQILNHSLTTLTGLATPAIELALDWQVVAPTDQVLKLSLRLADATGAAITWPDGTPAVEDHFPLRHVALTPTWPIGEIVHDVHTIYLPPAAQALHASGEALQLVVIVYDSDTTAEVGRIEILF